jgi:RNA polymerase sigma-70 factor (ECF subfamily)
VPADDKPAFVAAIASQHGERLRRFLASRIRNVAADINDLTQEVYLRLLRAPHHQRISNPQAYLITIANHVVHQHYLNLATSTENLDMTEALARFSPHPEEDPASKAEIRERIDALDSALRALSPRVHATFVLHRRYGFSLQEIGRHLGVSRPMVKKYLARAVALIRERYETFE